MSEPKKSMSTNAVVFGLLTGFTLILLSVVLFITNKSQSGLQYFGYLILGAGIVIGTMNFRDKYSEGYITYGRSLGMGVLISVFAGILLGIFTYIYIKYLNTGLVEDVIIKARQQWEAQHMTEEQMTVAEKYTRMFLTPAMILILTLVGYVFVGTIISLIASAFIKKDRPPFENVIDQKPA